MEATGRRSFITSTASLRIRKATSIWPNRSDNVCCVGITRGCQNELMNRSEMYRRFLTQPQPWDMIVVGGGATGVGVAIDAATRGYSVLLLEQHDFGKGTSSRSTKLVHGGVRYLEQGNLSLVMEALKERGLLAR